MLLNPKLVHIELSSKCVLKCPRCPRTELDLESLNREIVLAQFQKGFPPDVLARIKGMAFCGHIGDPIYATEFLGIVKYIKTNSATQLRIITNGSYRKEDWWRELGVLLDNRDHVTFSVDGWDQESNNLYRVNSDFNSIVLGVKTLRASSACQISWSSIYFQFNEDRISNIEKLAKDLGCDEFVAVKSSKFDGRYLVNGVDPLKPKNVARTSIYESQIISLTDKKSNLTHIAGGNRVHPWARCVRHEKEVFVNVNGLVLPCPWFENSYQFHDFVLDNKDRLNIHNHTFIEILNSDIWKEFLDLLNGENPPEICKLKCKFHP